MTRSGPLFTQVEIPGWNALTAGAFDASVEFQAQDPVTHLAYSMGALQAYLTPGPNARPAGVMVSDCPQGRNILGGCGPILGDKPMQSDGDTGEDWITMPILKDFVKRSALFIIAVVILAIALWKM